MDWNDSGRTFRFIALSSTRSTWCPDDGTVLAPGDEATLVAMEPLDPSLKLASSEFNDDEEGGEMIRAFDGVIDPLEESL